MTENKNSSENLNGLLTFDLDRMKRALNSETISLPNGLSKEEIIQFIIDSAKNNKGDSIVK